MGEILEVIVEFVFEFALKGPGYLIQRFAFGRNDADFDGLSAFLLSILLWVFVGLGIWGVVLLM